MNAVFKHVKGVKEVVSGYSGGNAKSPDYETVSTGSTGHADPSEKCLQFLKVTYSQLLRVFLSVATDPTELNRQGHNVGTQYRSVIFYSDDTQKQIALASIDQLNKAHVFPAPSFTSRAVGTFLPGQKPTTRTTWELHPDNPYIVYNDLPDLRAL